MGTIINFNPDTQFGFTLVDPEVEAYFKECTIENNTSGKGFTSVYFKFNTGKLEGGSDDPITVKFSDDETVYICVNDGDVHEGEFYITTEFPSEHIYWHLESSGLSTAYDLNNPFIEILEICEEDIL